MNDYVENIVNKAYHRLITSDNISKVRPEIIEILKKRSNSSRYLNIVSKALSERKEISLEEAQDLTKDYLFYIITQFQNIDEILDEINKKNRSYINSAINRTKYLLSDSEDVKGQLKEILSTLNEEINTKDIDTHGIYEIEYLDELIKIYSSLFPDEKSFYQPPADRVTFMPTELLIEEEDKELIEKKRDKILERMNRALNPEKINAFVLNQLAGRDEMNLSELPLETIDDFTKIVYTQLYGSRRNMDYALIRENPTRVEQNGYSFDDVKIVRKENGFSRGFKGK